MFGRHARLVVDVFLGIPTDDVKAKFKNKYSRKLRVRLANAYKKTREDVQKTAKNNERSYDQKAQATKTVTSHLVQVCNVTLRGKQKIADKSKFEVWC